MKQLAERFSWIDIERVGIYGHSGGGYATAGAMFHYPDFFKVGVSQAGNHDNRVYEDDWGEKWQGLLTRNADGETNYENQANQNFARNRKGKLLVVSHSLGTIVAYDTFWKFSRMGEYRHQYARRPIDLWITLGSPLGDTTVKRNLRGSRASGPRRFPCNVTRWENVAAEDDFISHDKRVADDYAAMKKEGLVRSIRDHTIHNLAVRNGRSNPHSSAGYLIHPTVVKLVCDWLDQS